MRNKRGINCLVELIAGARYYRNYFCVDIFHLLMVIMTSTRNSTNQQLQQEANYIAEAIRSEYLK